ncbi:hypothetical protein [Hymenobacter algoricola]|uniref:Uncharacterized protein n=1 Tax=Hymenobacter algoricola TaxID=486267 RepID=A0ABP7MHN4_9BACT
MLSTYSSQSLAVLLKQLPDLVSLVRIEGEEFQIEQLAPSGWNLWVSSEEEDRLTVGFAEYHCHFGGFQNDTPEAAAAAANCIQELRTGKLVVAVWYEGDKYAQSNMSESTETPKPWMWEHDQRPARALTLQIRKWAE